jgi:LysR family carnitine catabolism transcriptional activator
MQSIDFERRSLAPFLHTCDCASIAAHTARRHRIRPWTLNCPCHPPTILVVRISCIRMLSLPVRVPKQHSFDKCLDQINQCICNMNVDIHLLTAFLRVVDAGGFSAASRLHGLSQPTLSRQIRQLEDHLGQRVFDRDTRNVSLTAVGRELQSVATRLLADFERSLDSLAELTDGKRGRVVIAAIPSLAATLVPTAISKFAETHPAITVELRDGLTQSVVTAVLDGHADIGLTVRPPGNKELTFRALLQDHFVAASLKDAFAPEMEEISWSDFSRWPFIAFDKNSSIRMMTDAAFIQAKMVVEPRYECKELATVGGLVVANLGVAALPQLAVAQLSAEVGVRTLTAPAITRTLGSLISSRRALSPPAQSFLRCLVAQAKLSKYARS